MKSFSTFVTEQSNQEKLIDLLMLEALNPSQMKIAKQWSSDNPITRTVDQQHDKVFGGKGIDRVTIPLESPPKDWSGHPLHDEIKSHIEPYGFKISDYAKNEATDKHGRATTITKALGKAAPSHLQSYNNDPARQAVHQNAIGPKKMVTISRNPIDVAGMSTGRKWDNTSCMNMSGGYNRKYIKADMNHGTLAAYVHDEHDTDLQNPHGRILIKRHTDIENPHHGDSIFHPESRVYGTGGGDFQHTVKKWVNKNYPAHPDKIYAKHEDLYNDDGKTFSGTANKFHPKVLQAHVDRATVNYEGENNNNKIIYPTPHHSHVGAMLTHYRRGLPEEEQKKMDLHLHLRLAHEFHNPEGNGYKFTDHPSDHHHNHDDDENHSINYHTHDVIPIHPEHVDEIAKKYHETWKSSYDDGNVPEDHHAELEYNILKHGSDNSKAEYLRNTHMYGHEPEGDMVHSSGEFNSNKHIVGPHTAKAYYEHIVKPQEDTAHEDDNDYNTNEPNKTHFNMAKHADDETFHNWLHSPAVQHHHDSYQAMTQGASKDRQHKLIDTLNHDQGEPFKDGSAIKKYAMANSSRSKSVLHRLMNHPFSDDATKSSAAKSLVDHTEAGTLTESLLTRIKKLI